MMSNKRFLSLFLLLGLVAALGLSCGGDDDDDNDDNDTDDDVDDDTGDDDTGDDDTGDDDTGDDDTGDDDTGDSFWSEDFDAMAPGPLGDPWIVVTNNATVEVVALKDGSGNVVEINDSSANSGDGCSATIDLSGTEGIGAAFTFSYDMVMSTGNSLGFAGVQYDSGLGDYFAEFYIDFEDDALTSLGGSGEYVDCAAFDPAVWHTVQVEIDPVGHTYSVILDDAATACTDFGFLYGDQPFAGFAFYGYDGESWYGVGQIDNLTATAAAK